jgi:uncharacterized RDD family membrane protein YckC
VLNPFTAIADLVVPNVVDAVDIDDVVARIDVDALLGRVDLDALVARIDINTILERADINALLDRVDIDAFVSRVDADALVSRVDADALVARVDVNSVLDRADVEALLERVDVEALLERVDVERLIGRVDPNVLLSRVDIEALLGRIDPNALLERVDMEQLIDRIDVDAVLDRVDVDRIIDRVDVARIVQRADLRGIVQEGTRGITGSMIDLVRRQLVGIDVIATGVGARLVRRDPGLDPKSPPALVTEQTDVDGQRRRPSVSGRYAGPSSRAVAMFIDVTTLLFLFGVATAVTTWTVDRLFGTELAGGSFVGWVAIALLATWAFGYIAVPLAMTGRTFGKAVVGLRVVRRDGTPLLPAQAAVRTLVLPFSWLFLGLGLLGGVFGRERRTWHDVLARTTEVIDWGDRPAELPTPLARWIDEHRPESQSVPTATPQHLDTGG